MLGHFFENKENPVKRLVSDKHAKGLEPELSFSCEERRLFVETQKYTRPE